MRAIAMTLKHELIGLSGVVERIKYLTKRYILWDVAFFVWTIANTLTIVFIGEGVEATGGDIDVERVTTQLLVGAVVSEGHLINMAWAAAIGLVLHLFFRFTKQGIAMRAVTDDPETARLMGIPVRFVVMLTWGMAGFLAAFRSAVAALEAARRG